jgi:hypothetical protein
VSPTAAVTVLGLKVRLLFGPTMTCWVAAKTVADCINAKADDLVKCILMVEGLSKKNRSDKSIQKVESFLLKECIGSGKGVTSQ